VIGLQFGHIAGNALQILCLGAHSDDIEIGCGATLLRLLEEHPGSTVQWVVFSGSEQRADETQRSARLFLRDATHTQIVTHRFRDGFFPYIGAEIKEVFEQIKSTHSPDLIFTHHGQDLHQDHRVISELTWNTFRKHLILEYEIPKYDGGLGTPNLYVTIAESARVAKIEHLMEVFASQRDKLWFSAQTFDALMRLRGIECVSPTGYAEGFHARKLAIL
jgi:LmbE family N-acetylglucosaminyl deacetylase